MEKYKYLLKNVGIMTLASFGTKILSFLMVPLYTNILSTEAYGTYDIYQTTLFLIVPVLSLNIADGIMRAESKKYQMLPLEALSVRYRCLH